jgi:GNAT superfamily N-acetyltransferase
MLPSLQRSAFEERAQAILKAPDVRHLSTHYGTPPSGLWILRLGDGFIGLVALDGARVRHLFVDEPFRRAGAQADLLSFALAKAFTSPGVRAVQMTVDPLRPYVRDGARAAGLRRVREGSERVGLFGWRTQEWEITREEWERARQAS